MTRFREVCLSLPDAYEQETWGEATFRVRKKIFATAWDREGRASVCMKVPREDHEALLAQGDPFFLPAYVGTKGWIGIDLGSARLDRDELHEMVLESYRLIAPKRLSALLDDPPA
jgi:predicted DNA-binding protein (MmcQ/YjbR family)